MSEEKPKEFAPAPSVPGAPTEPKPEESSCLGALLLLAFWTTIWLGLCFLVYWKVSTVAAALVFFLPPLGFFLWAIFTKPAGLPGPKGGLDRKQ